MGWIVFMVWVVCRVRTYVGTYLCMYECLYVCGSFQ